ATARADVNGPREIRDAAINFNSLLATVTEQRDRVKAAAASDPLTGVTNKQQFHESLGIELKRAEREGTAVSLVCSTSTASARSTTRTAEASATRSSSAWPTGCAA